ncbi:MAG: adenylate/guanylate cyclase domain-containing protein, partial [Candidatus Promineifilaceae bacterium]
MKFNRKVTKPFVWHTRLRPYDIPEGQVNALQSFVAKAAGHELFQANPRYLATQMMLPESAGLNLLITAVAAGLFTLNWHTTCPVCLTAGRAVQNLGEIESQTQCHHCGHHYTPHLDDEISVTLTATAALHPTEVGADNPAFRAEVDDRLGKTPALNLINIPAFRRLIADQQLNQGHWLGVKRLVIFFSDLRQSTAFYNKLGDAEAFHWVREHFQIMFAAVEQCGGTAVKTIGDGIMGVFTDPENAVTAIALGMQGLAQLNDAAGFVGQDRLTLKVGMHQGACIVVTLNGRLDYFGETVNIAARLTGLSSGGDIILSPTIMADAKICTQAEKLGQVSTRLTELRGLPNQIELHRLVLDRKIAEM